MTQAELIAHCESTGIGFKFVGVTSGTDANGEPVRAQRLMVMDTTQLADGLRSQLDANGLLIEPVVAEPIIAEPSLESAPDTAAPKKLRRES